MDVAIVKASHNFIQLNQVLSDQAHIYIFCDAKEIKTIYSQLLQLKWQVHNLLYWRVNHQLILMARKGKAYQITNCGDKMILLYPTLNQVVNRFIENSLKEGKVYNDFI